MLTCVYKNIYIYTDTHTQTHDTGHRTVAHFTAVAVGQSDGRLGRAETLVSARA